MDALRRGGRPWDVIEIDRREERRLERTWHAWSRSSRSRTCERSAWEARRKFDRRGPLSPEKAEPEIIGALAEMEPGEAADLVKRLLEELKETEAEAFRPLLGSALSGLAERRCTDRADLAAITWVGPAKLERYADEVLAVVAAG